MIEKIAAAAVAVLVAVPAHARCSGGNNVSWYGEPQKVRSGEAFNPNASTCAHPTLPDGSIVRVKVPGSHAVDCLVNDLGPNPWTGCKLDVSRHVAKLLGLLERGVGRFEIEVVRRGWHG